MMDSCSPRRRDLSSIEPEAAYLLSYHCGRKQTHTSVSPVRIFVKGFEIGLTLYARATLHNVHEGDRCDWKRWIKSTNCQRHLSCHIISKVLLTINNSLHMLFSAYSSDSRHLSTLRQHLFKSHVQDAKPLFDLLSSYSHWRCKTEHTTHTRQVDDIAR